MQTPWRFHIFTYQEDKMEAKEMASWLREFVSSLIDCDLTTVEEDNILTEIADHLDSGGK